jgi:uncharacterized protein YkwD
MRAVLALAALALLLAPSGGAVAGDPLAPPAQMCSLRAGAGALVCLVNTARTRAGLRPLQVQAPLVSSASQKGRLLRRCGELVHSPCGVPFASQFRHGPLGAGRFEVGENLAWGSGQRSTPRATLLAWLASPAHRSVLLRREWRQIGVAVFPLRLSDAGPGLAYVAQFATYLPESHAFRATRRS